MVEVNLIKMFHRVKEVSKNALETLEGPYQIKPARTALYETVVARMLMCLSLRNGFPFSNLSYQIS